MFNFRTNSLVPGFRVEPPEEVPGFRLNDDGSIREATAPAAPSYPDVNGDPTALLGQRGLDTNSFTAVGDGTPPPYLTFGGGVGGIPPSPPPVPPFTSRFSLGFPDVTRPGTLQDTGQARPVGDGAPPSAGRSPRTADLLADPSAPLNVTPVSCKSFDGTLDCTTPGGQSFDSLPAPKGFPDISPKSSRHHEYRYESAPFYNPKEVMRQVIERPTLGPSSLNSAATLDGTANEATPEPYYTITEGLKAAAGLHLPSGPVKSHVTTDQHGNPIVVNVTQPGHALFPGYVAHYTVKADDGSYRLVTEGEGLGLLQGPGSPQALRDFLNRRTWENYHKHVIGRSESR